jgi:hypothetical protein
VREGRGERRKGKGKMGREGERKRRKEKGEGRREKDTQ